MGKGRSRRGAGGGGRGCAPASASDVERVAATLTLTDAAARHGLQVTDVGTGWPPVMEFLFACSDGDLDRVKAVVNAMDEGDRESLASLRFAGCGPLYSAAGSGDMAICKYLVEQLGFDVDSDATDHGSGHLQSYRMDPYVVLTHSYGLQGAFGYWVQPVGDGSTGYIQPVRMAVA